MNDWVRDESGGEDVVVMPYEDAQRLLFVFVAMGQHIAFGPLQDVDPPTRAKMLALIRRAKHVFVDSCRPG